MLADPDQKPALIEDAPAGTVPVERSIDLAIVADPSLTLKKAVGEIARWTDVQAKSPKALLEALARRAERERPPLLVVDQLDEARDAAAIASLLRRLVQAGAARALIGLRKGDDDSLRRGLEPMAKVIDLDLEPYFEAADLTRYARDLLLEGKAYKTDPDAAEPVAKAVAERAEGSFLVAWLVATSLAKADGVSRRPADEFPNELGTAMDEYVEAAAEHHARDGGDRSEIEERIRDLLAALAYAEGPGLPSRGEVWPAVAEAVSGRPFRPKDAHWLRRSAARYLVQVGGGSGRARLFHRELARRLRADRHDEEVQCRIARALGELCPFGGRKPAPSYVEAHLAGHVAKAPAGAWDELVQVPTYSTGSTLSRSAPRLGAAGAGSPICHRRFLACSTRRS